MDEHLNVAQCTLDYNSNGCLCYAQLGKEVDGMTCIIDMDNVGTSFLWGPG